jgi:hypothetical protein
MLSQNLYEGDNSDLKSDKDLFAARDEGESSDTKECCHRHCFCTRHSVASPCCSVSWKKPFDRALCGLSGCIIFLLLLGVIAPMLVNNLVYSGIREAVVIDSTSASSYDVWQSNFFGDADDPPVVNYDVYLFDLQNEHAALNGSRPIVTERGPYAFLEYYNKFDISWSDDGDTVTYSSQKFFLFNQERTGAGLSLDDEIKLTYPTAVGFQYLLAEIPEAAEAALDAALEGAIDSKLLEIEETIANLEEAIENGPDTPTKNETLAELEMLSNLLEVVRVGLDSYINTTNVGDTLLKLLLCGNNPDRVSPFWTTDPVSAYFGWLNDPVLVAVQNLLNAANMSDVPWSTAVSSLSIYY